MTNKVYQGYRIQIFPNKVTREKLEKIFNAKIIAYNWGLEQQLDCLNKGLELLSRKQLTSQFMANLEYNNLIWIKDEHVSRHTIYYAFNDLNDTMYRYLKHLIRKPKFKSVNDSRKTFCQRNDMRLIVGHKIQIANVGKISSIPSDIDRVGIIHKPNQLAGIRFIKEPTGKYFVSFNKLINPIKIQSGTTSSIGIDLGLKTWATDSTGSCLNFPIDVIASKMKKLATLNKKLSRQEKGSIRYISTLRSIELINEDITNITEDKIKKYVHSLILLNPKSIVMEDLAVSQMNQSNWFHSKLAQSKFRYFRDEVEYQATRNGIKFILADRYFPSTQICSFCGNRKKVDINTRTYHCERCGNSINRDLNAAINLSNYTKD